jgi:hypothetical protein
MTSVFVWTLSDVINAVLLALFGALVIFVWWKSK